MSKRQVRLTILLSAAFLLSLWLINRDLFHYEYIHPYSRNFTPQDYEKGDYLLTEELTLKPGDYQILITGSTNWIGNGYYALGSDGEIVSASDFPVGEFSTAFPLTIEGSARQIRVGVRYDPEYSDLQIEQIQISSDHVLYADSLLRHLTLSFCLLLFFAFLTLRFAFTESWRRHFPRLSNPDFERTFLFLLALALFTCWPFLGSNDYILADDMQFHLSRIEGIKTSLQAGYFPARIHLFVLQNYGYGVGFYYPDLLLYFPAILRLLGFALMDVYKFYVALCTFLALCTIYLTARRIAASRFAGHCAAILFAFSCYRLIDVFYRGALGELQSFIFIPLVVWGLYEIFSGNPRRWPIFAAGFCGLVCSHLISLMIVGLTTALFLLLRIRQIIHNRQIFMALCKSVVVTLGAGAFFLLPMIEQTLTNQVTANLLISTLPGDITESRVLNPRYLFSFFENWGTEVVYPGWAFVLIPLLRLFLIKKHDPALKAADWILAFGTAAAVMCTSLFPWQWFVWLFNRIQFSWRLMLITTVLLPLAGGILLSLLMKTDKQRLLSLIIIFCFCAVTAEPIFYETVQNRTVRNIPFLLQNNRIGGGEYLPRWLSVEYIDKTRDTVLSDVPGMEVSAHDRRGLSFTFSYQLPSDEDQASFTIPLIAYTGYRAAWSGPDGQPYPLKIEKNEQGLVKVSVPQASSGIVRVWYQKTVTQWISEVISLVTVLWSAAAFLRRRSAIHSDRPRL